MKQRRMLFALCAALFVTMLDTTVVSVALPDLQQHKPVTIADLQWVVNGYLVVFTSLMLTGGVLADRLGRRRLLLIGLVIFAAGSLITVVTDPHGGWDGLRIGRIVQGLGAALSEPATLAVIRQEYDDEKRRARALGVWAAVSGLALAFGPVVGGLLVELGGWRAVFIANIPLAVACLVLAVIYVPESHDPERRRLDPAGLVLGAVAVGGVSWALIDAQDKGFRSGAVIGAFVAAGVAAAGYVLAERRVREPLIPRGLLADRGVRAGLIGALSASFAVYAVFFFVTLDLQTVGKQSAAATAGAYLPMTLAMVGAAYLSGRWAAHRGTTPPLVSGLLLGAVGLGIAQLVLGLHPKADVVGPALVVVGAGLGLTLAPATAAVLRGVGAQRAGLGAAVVNEARQVGGLLAVAALGAVTIGRLDGALTANLRKVGLAGFRDRVFTALTHGGGGKPDPVLDSPLFKPIVDTAKIAAENAFVSGLRLALAVATGVLVVTAALVAAAGRRPTDAVR